MLEVSLKVKVLGKHLDSGMVLHPIGHPIYTIGETREEQSRVELQDDLVIPWVLKRHDVVNLVVFIGCDDLIEEWVVLVPHACPLDVFHRNHHIFLGLGQ
jgi:hypothetical protein